MITARGRPTAVPNNMRLPAALALLDIRHHQHLITATRMPTTVIRTPIMDIIRTRLVLDSTGATGSVAGLEGAFAVVSGVKRAVANI